MRDPYETLGVSRSASLDEIKKAYRSKVRATHPDRNKHDPKAAEKFNEVQQAYDILSTPDKRKQYDEFGEAAFDRNVPPGGGTGGFNPFGAGRAYNYTWNGKGFRPQNGGPEGEVFDAESIGDFLRGFGMGGFGRGGAKRGRRGRQPVESVEAGEDIKAEVNVPFMDAVKGGICNVQIRANGRAKTIEVRIPAGIADGGKLRVRGQGQPSPFGGPAGDLILTVRVGEHATFRREGSDLLVDAPLSPADAVLGANVTVPTLDGKVEVKIPPGTSSGAKLRVRGQGAPTPSGGRGDLFVVVKIVVPKHLTPQQKDLYEKLRGLG